ncbi:hypothetical protein KIW_07805 [Pediococcus acidilactici MA18/5M]|nr:hypothetical protein KIW_07805 [Pediococcus acidilactici MA18/5M]
MGGWSLYLVNRKKLGAGAHFDTAAAGLIESPINRGLGD